MYMIKAQMNEIAKFEEVELSPNNTTTKPYSLLFQQFCEMLPTFLSTSFISE